jgi:hypothetical protein
MTISFSCFYSSQESVFRVGLDHGVGLGSLKRQGIYYCPKAQTGSGTQPASYSVGTEGKEAGREAAHSSPYSGEVKNDWSVTSKSPTCFRAFAYVLYPQEFCNCGVQGEEQNYPKITDLVSAV